MRTRSLVLASFLLSPLAAGCGTGTPAPNTASPSGGGNETAPKVVIEDSTETWYEEESAGANPGDPSSKIRQFNLDVTKHVEWKNGGGTLLDAGPPPADKVYRVSIRFPVPKVQPDGARDPHAINRLLWDVRKEIAKCYYKGPGKEPGDETSMIGWLSVSKQGEVTGGGVERADAPLEKSPGFTDCVVENVKGLAFSPIGDDTKVRYKLKFQTSDVTGQPGIKAPPPAAAE